MHCHHFPSLLELRLNSLREWVVSSSLWFCKRLASGSFYTSGFSALSIEDLRPLTSFSTASRTLVRPLQPSHMKDTASQQKPLGGRHCALIVISFLVLRSKLSRSSFVQFTIPAECLTTGTVYISIMSILFQACACQWDLSISGGSGLRIPLWSPSLSCYAWCYLPLKLQGICMHHLPLVTWWFHPMASRYLRIPLSDPV